MCTLQKSKPRMLEFPVTGTQAEQRPVDPLSDY